MRLILSGRYSWFGELTVLLEGSMSKPDFGEPWHVEADGDKGIYRIIDVKSRTVLARKGGEYSVEMLRVVKLVNACAGLTDEELKRVRAVIEMYESCSKFVAWAEDNRDMVLRMGIKNLHEFILMKAALALADGRE